MESPEHQALESLAYSIYLAEGRPEGRELQHWLEAEEQFEVECQFTAECGCRPNLFQDEAAENLDGQQLLFRV